MTLFKRQVPLHLQFSETECGIASLAMVLAYFGTHVSIEELRYKCGSSRDGCKASTLMKVAQEYGYDASAYSVELSDLYNLKQPVIAFWNFSHYVVIKRASSSSFYINDPAQGALKVSFDDVDKSFTGVIIVINPTANKIQIKKQPQARPLLKEWMSKVHLELFFVILCLLAISTVPLLNSSLSTLFVNYCILYSNPSWIPYLSFVSFGLLLILIIATIYQKTTEFKLCAKTSITKSYEIIVHVFQLPLIFYAVRHKSEIIAMLSRVEIVINALFTGLCGLIMCSISTFFCLFFMVKIDKSLFITSFALSVFSILVSVILTRFTLAREKSNLNSLAKWYVYTASCIRNIETIILCGLEGSVVSKWSGLYSNKLSQQDKVNTINCLGNAINQAFSSASLLTILFVGSYQIREGYLSIGHLMGYYALHLFLIKHLGFLVKTFKDIQNAYVSHARINDVFQHEVDVSNVSHHISRDIAIHCHNLGFCYNKNEPMTLSDINIKINFGQHIALVGKSGCGKSTLAKLLSALHQATTGGVSYSNGLMQKHISYVSQDISLFTGTIHGNLTLWQDDISPDLINYAIETACLTDLISSRGLYGRVEEYGDNLSGGEKQRIELARALIENRPILVLDEATSALDIQTESKILSNLRKSNKTIIFVAHRLSTISHCDQIFVMENGMIVEQGRHDELLANRDCYYQLVKCEK